MIPAIEYRVTDTNIHIYDSYKVSKYDMWEEIARIEIMYPSLKVWERSSCSLCTEWCAHNFLYSLGIARRRTKDVDLNVPQRWWVKVGYFIVGGFGSWFIR